MKIELTGLADLKADIGVIRKFLTGGGLPPILQRLSEDAKALMKDRVVEDGEDTSGNPFAPYSDRYLKYKKKRGGKNYVPGLVNLYDTGKLMTSIQTKLKTMSQAIIYVASPRTARYGWAHQVGGGRMPIREWFGLTTTEREVLQRAFVELASRELSGV